MIDLDGTAVTYAELRARSNQLAHWLRRQGVGPDVPVALSLERSAEQLVALLAVHGAGGAYVPLDPEYPVERRVFGLKDSGAPLLLTRPEWGTDLPETGARIVDLGALDLSAESTEDLPRVAGPENLAYLLYTSGSTGRPKGVAMVRGALDNLIAWQTAVLPGAWRTLQFTSLNFDVSYQEIFSTWAAGGTLVLISEEDRRDPERLLAVLRERQVERLFLPFVALQQLAEAEPSPPSGERGIGLREVITAGEQLRITPALAEMFRRLPGARLHNHYGPTESHVVAAFTLDGDPETWPALPPVGRPLPGTRAVILDPHGGPAPLGVPGELCLGGVCLARGYLGRPELTAERFVPDPFADGDRLYRTGDRARLRSAGEIEYLGRLDDQVKIRGYRVEPGEVETAIAAHPGVAEAVVGIRESAAGNRRLMAWVVPRGAAPKPTPDDLRAFLAGRLPDYEVPSSIAVVEAFPLTPSGKVDRRRLLAEAPIPEAVETAAGYVEPRTATEELLAGIWAEVLELPRVGVEDDFFALGGHSLLATRITARVRTLFGVGLPVRALFEAPTVARLAVRIEKEAGDAGDGALLAARLREAVRPAAPDAPTSTYVAPRTPHERLVAKLWSEVLGISRIGALDDFFILGGHSLLATRIVARLQKLLGVVLPVRTLFEVPTVEALALKIQRVALGEGAGERSSIPRVPRDRPLPLSFAQERIWFLEQLKPGTPAYHLPASLDLRGALDPAALALALAEIFRRHEALRTVFHEEGGMPVQRILPPPPPSLPLIDLQGLPAGAREAEAERIAAAWFQRPFDLRGEPMLRAGLLCLQPGLHRLLLLQHHIASDGWSFGVLIREVVALYPRFAGLAEGAAPLPELPIQYADFAVWQRGELQGDALDRLVDAWRERLAGAPPATDLPTDRPRPPVQELQGESLSTAYRQTTALHLLGGLARSERATLFMVLLAVYQTLLQRWTGADDLVVGTPVAGRQRPELEGLIGVFINTLALRGRLDGEPSFRELLGRARETAFEAYALQDLPFETLVKRLHPVRDLARPPVFQTMFVLQNTPVGRLELPGLVLEPRDADARGAKLEMLLSVSEEEGGLKGGLEYNTVLFDRSTAERFLRHFGSLMESAAAQPDLPISRLPLLAVEERRQLLGEWGNGGTLARTDDLLHARFQALAAAQPSAPALTWNGRDLSYGDLAARSWRLARHLRDLGVGPEVRVGVSLERSPDLVIAILAVLAAGGAYVPIEPALPAERRAFLIRDTQMPVLITRRGLLGGLPVDGLRILDPGEAATVVAGYDPAPLPGFAAPDNLAYLIYTSGSTGVPKGVAIPHRSAVSFLRWAETLWSREDLAAVLAATSVSFDLSVFELFAPLSVGGKAVLVENALRLRELMEGEGVTLVNTVPSAMAEVARLGAVPPSVRVVNLAGEPLRRRLADELFALGVPRVLNLYGPSEDTTYSTWEELRRGDAQEPGIGRPIAGTRAYVLDRNLEPTPEGVPGELCLAGAGLARGYLGRPDLTAERFVPDPFSAKPAARLYRTGDRARWRPRFASDTTLEFLGRLDHQVKVRGFRIELGEIEAALAACPGIAEAAVLVREREGDRRLEAFLAAAPGAEPGLTAIRADLARRLPEYMIPSSVLFLASLPHTATGKIDRRALAQIEMSPGSVRREYVAPRTEVEVWLVETCSALLGVEHVGLRDRFFDLGGHSLLATQLVSRLRDEWKVELALQDVFAASDLGDLADRITDLGLGQAGDDDLAEALAELGVSPEDLDALLKG